MFINYSNNYYINCMAVERVDFSNDDEYRQALEAESQAYQDEQAREEYEAEQQQIQDSEQEAQEAQGHPEY